MASLLHPDRDLLALAFGGVLVAVALMMVFRATFPSSRKGDDDTVGDAYRSVFRVLYARKATQVGLAAALCGAMPY